ncbi:peptide-N4-asparagine amidase [Kitasatospora viridis]|uniref:Peptide N-acetyl-beta-D-glucosaminyl asparaginase amidase A n=1 Tax=Kitasatospora viridis TaxID=281105 RepID=A0A561UBK7_9ACTN|nr:peptide-N4-asparagine amidase [Kitasatospora viridis]TWF96753.1 peptide N-acetyl-beta-D-glucosaminyl asparaginase amidase A [Kitasatospora viridis]
MPTVLIPSLIRRSRRALTALALAAATVLIVPAAATAAPAGATAPTANRVETNYGNPVTALPPISRPSGKHCTVTAMQHDFANSYGQPFTGTLTPPSDCPGPWSKVVLDWNGSVAGRQYDRLAGVWIGGAEVLRTSTPEPDPAGISWHVDQDLTPFVPLLRTAQPVVVDLGNVVNSTYTGTYHMTMTVTYYQADRDNPPAATADQVLPVSQSTTAAGWWTLNKGQTATASLTFPRNLTGLRMQVYARGGGCEEFWYSNVPDDFAAAHPDWGLCGGGTYREVQVLVDGRLAGTVQPFPAIYTGGISPLMWRPIPSIDAFRTQPYDVDLTPFAGTLTDGRPHTVTLVPPAGISDSWTLDGNLFLTTDPLRAQTTGAVTTDTIAAAPQSATTEAAQPDGSELITVTAGRDWTVSGYVDTSRGRITTRIDHHGEYRNTDTLSDQGQQQVTSQRDSGWTVVSTGDGHGRPDQRRSTWSYPLDVTSTYVPGTGSDSFTATGKVSVARELTDQARHGQGAWKQQDRTDDRLQAQGVLQRQNGTELQADGSSHERYLGSTADGGCYEHELASDHGYLTLDRVSDSAGGGGCR